MVLWSYPPTRRQLAMTAALFITSVSMIAYGAHQSLLNMAPQQARAKARSDYVRKRLRQMLDD